MSLQPINTAATDRTSTVKLERRTSSGRIIRRPAWRTDYADPDSVPEEEEASHDSNGNDTNAESRLSPVFSDSFPGSFGVSSNFPVPSLAPERHASLVQNDVREGSATSNTITITTIDKPASGVTAAMPGNEPTITVPSTPGNLVTNPTVTREPLQRSPSIKIKHSRSPSLGIISSSSSSSKRHARGHLNIVFNFIVPLPEGEVLVEGSKPDSMRLDLNKCTSSDEFFTQAKIAWEIGSKSAEGSTFKAVRCTWNGSKTNHVVPWGDGVTYQRVLGYVRNTLNGEMIGEMDVNVSCIRW